MAKNKNDIVAEKTQGKARSSRWRVIRRAFLMVHSSCAVCGGTKKLEVHHIHPFHLHPDLELDPSNLVTLCENERDGVNCHLLFGHLGSFKSYNPHILLDAKEWREKIQDRP